MTFLLTSSWFFSGSKADMLAALTGGACLRACSAAGALPSRLSTRCFTWLDSRGRGWPFTGDHVPSSLYLMVTSSLLWSFPRNTRCIMSTSSSSSWPFMVPSALLCSALPPLEPHKTRGDGEMVDLRCSFIHGRTTVSTAPLLPPLALSQELQT
ncbi:hypothetical protein CRUP_031965 [Coryphaenoides rupestris]|nr:hypothetical protein CRUP_031965 [Coryphaenoides rupestris]